MSILTSSEMFFNIKKPPIYNPRKNYFEQTKEVLDFYEEEKSKIINGVYIGGFFVHPWLYFHLNFFKTPIPIIDENGRMREEIMNPPLDDNFMYTAESYEQAENENKGLCVFGSRGYSKSTHITSLVSWLNTTKSNGTTSITGGSDTDLKAISSLMETSFTNSHPAFFVPRLISNWDSEIVFGIKEKNQKKMIHSRIAITNANKGSDKDSEKGAGLSPVGAVFDEIGKYKSKKNLDSALPSYVTQHGAKLVHFLAGCVCAGTKVWSNDGRLINIEDLKPVDGILGFDVNNYKISKEDITYWQPPHEKVCYRIETSAGRVLECSEDHPIFCRDTKINTYNKSTRERARWMGFREAKDIKKKDLVGISSFIPFTGDKIMWEPRFTGWLIGDGTYGHDKSTRMSSCDDEVNDYLNKNFDCTVTKTYKTKEGKDYKETSIRGIRKHLTSIGIANQVKSYKTLPKDIHTYRHEDICEMLGGFFDADGHVIASSTKASNNYSINLSSGHKSILTEVQLLLQRIGIHSLIWFRKDDRFRGIAGGKPFKAKGHYLLRISDKLSVTEFYKNIKFSIGYKQDKLNDVINFLKNKGVKVSKEYNNMRFEPVKSIECIGMKPVYNLTAGNTHTYIANGIITHNTGGNQELSQDAKDILADPVAHNLIMMNWDRLDRSVPEEAMTWNRSRKTSFSMFAPGQMSYRLDVPKVKQSFSKYLGIDNKDLESLDIMVTDWRAATTRIQEKNASLKKEKDRYKNQMYFPLEIADCFLTSSENPFPVTTIEKHIRYLEDRGIMGKSINIYRDGKKYKQEFSGKQRAEVSHTGGLADAPVLLFGAFPENETPPRGLYVSGLDGYKLDQSGTDSLGAFYVLKRRNQAPNEPCETIAASYAARPERMRDFHTTCEVMSDTWNAECLMESADMGFKQFLEAKGREYDVLAARISFNSLSSQKKNKTKSEFGLYPTAGNNTYRFNLLVDMTKEEHLHEIDDNGEQIFKLGVEYIDDIDLLKEMRDWFKGGNFDRIDAYSHALVHARELDKKNIQPENVNKKAKLSGKEAAKKRQLLGNNRYGMNRGNRF